MLKYFVEFFSLFSCSNSLIFRFFLTQFSRCLIQTLALFWTFRTNRWRWYYCKGTAKFRVFQSFSSLRNFYRCVETFCAGQQMTFFHFKEILRPSVISSGEKVWHGISQLAEGNPSHAHGNIIKRSRKANIFFFIILSFTLRFRSPDNVQLLFFLCKELFIRSMYFANEEGYPISA